MRLIKREYTTTRYQILESKEGKVSEVGQILLEGGQMLQAARKTAMKKFPDQNVFIGDTETEKAVYKMPAQKFIELAEKEVL